MQILPDLNLKGFKTILWLCHSHGARAVNYQSLPIEDLPTSNQQGGFMEDPPNTAQYRKTPNIEFTKYRPVLNTGANTCIEYTNTTSQIQIPPSYSHGFSTLILQAGTFLHIPAPFHPPGGFSPS
ncbi:hypothetical protein O181_079891 [Austropuccinia psidii MF-1]|uniref:Uncharacterized protein n=1 Tax=Austropuccinia psidii MF-1 TaxID=1389203 RepID=A0A9Q3IEE6_9BASI|nr:hypothetical protein [Austropuccinia psidii MF-1]